MSISERQNFHQTEYAPRGRTKPPHSFPCPGSQELIRTAAKAGEWKRNRNAVLKGQCTLNQAGYQDTSKSRAVPGAEEGAVPPPQGVPVLSLSPALDGGRSQSSPFLGAEAQVPGPIYSHQPVREHPKSFHSRSLERSGVTQTWREVPPRPSDTHSLEGQCCTMGLEKVGEVREAYDTQVWPAWWFLGF